MNPDRDPEAILGPYRVLDLTDEKGFLCGKFLGDMGADVIKVEPPGGSSCPQSRALLRRCPGPEPEPVLVRLQRQQAGHHPGLREPRWARDLQAPRGECRLCG